MRRPGAVAKPGPDAPDQVDRCGVIAGDFVGTLEGYEGAGEAEPGAVWRVGGLVEKPSPEAALSNLYIVGRYLLSPLVMELLASQQPGKGGEIQLSWPRRTPASPARSGPPSTSAAAWSARLLLFLLALTCVMAFGPNQLLG